MCINVTFLKNSIIKRDILWSLAPPSGGFTQHHLICIYVITLPRAEEIRDQPLSSSSHARDKSPHRAFSASKIKHLPSALFGGCLLF